METEHTETVVEKAVAFVKHTLGIPPADKPPARNSAQEALDEIRNASINSTTETMSDNKKLPTESEMQQAIERARGDANSNE